MNITKLIFLKGKNFFLPLIFCMFLLLMIIFSNTNISSSKAGLFLWANSIVPTLLPFFIATELLSHTFVIPLLGKTLNIIMRPIFNVPGEGAFALIMGIISGYPAGARIVTNFYTNKIISLEEAERLISFTNNSGPLFIVGTVGINMFCDSRTGILLLLTHVLACITVGIIFRFWKRKKHVFNKYNVQNNFVITYENSVNLSNLGEVLSDAITKSISTILLIGGFVVLFSVITSMLTESHLIEFFSRIINHLFSFFNIDLTLSKSFVCGLFEITNGIKMISEIKIKTISQNIILTSFLIGFGGFSVLLQVLSIISKAKISPKPYIIGKVLHGIFAALYTFIILNTTSIFNLDIF